MKTNRSEYQANLSFQQVAKPLWVESLEAIGGHPKWTAPSRVQQRQPSVGRVARMLEALFTSV